MTTEEKAKAYAETRLANDLSGKALVCDRSELLFNAYDIEQAYEDGAIEALTSQWVSVKDGLPEIPAGKQLIRVLVWIGDEPLVCWYTCRGRFITTLAAKERYSYNRLTGVKVHLSSEREDVTEIVTHWLPIPPLKGGDA